jgi:ABC-2 type transport system permease protein/sodium transport system permease protein
MSGGEGPPRPTAPGAGGPSRLARLVRKELSEILRDRRTVLTLFIMPLLLYPLLSVAFQQYLLAGRLSTQEEPALRIGFRNQQEGERFWRELQHGQKVLRREAGSRGKAADEPPRPPAESAVLPDVKDAVLGNLIDLGVRVPGVTEARPPGKALACELVYLKGSTRGRAALDLVRGLLAAAQRGHLQASLRAAGGPPGVIVLRPQDVPVEDPAAARPFSLAPVIPLVLILMTITGAVYPAIDLTAGERERGTLEILVAAPVPRLGLLFAKYVSVLTVAVLTALVNLATMFVTIGLSGLGASLFPDGGPSAALMAELFGLLLLFAAFFSAVLLTITSFARSFKEAQAYLIPLMLASLGPGLLAILPGMELAGLWTAVPLVNIVLLSRDLLEGKDVLPAAWVVIGSTLLYALAAVAAAARIFGSEGVLYNEQGTWSDFWRRPAAPRPAATVAGALFCLALMFPAQFVLQGLIARAMGPDPGATEQALSVALMALASVLLFGAFPVVAALWRRIHFRSGLLLRPAPWATFPGAVLLGLSLWPFVLDFLALTHAWHLTGMSAESRQRVGTALQTLRAALPPYALVAAFVVPAVFEELFFRGFLFSALRAGSGPWTAVILSALLFGLFHLVATDAFALERLLPSTFLGLVLGWLCLRSGSVVPSMILHACHNGVLASLTAFGPTWLGQATHFLPGAWLLAAAGGAAGGMVLVLWSGRSRRPMTPADRTWQADPAASQADAT